uniref:Uncharacterized protein n=1 Tax=Mus spicilegus TaxID=10103 RepID=A0A8C6GB53_MUSSI
MSITEENSQMRMLMREVKYFKQYRVMSMTFYVRKNGKCQLHTVWADKGRKNSCSLLWYLFHKTECPKIEATDFRLGTWVLRHASRHFPKIYFCPSYEGVYSLPGPSYVYLQIHFVSNTTILFEVKFINDMNYNLNLTGALATGTNITQEMWEEYMKLTQQLGIPIENIENVYETGKLVPVKVNQN